MLRVILVLLVCPCTAFAQSLNGVSCLIEPTQHIALGTPVTGVLSRVLVKRGSLIRQGQV